MEQNLFLCRLNFYKYSQTGPYVGQTCCSLFTGTEAHFDHHNSDICIYLGDFIYSYFCLHQLTQRATHTDTCLLFLMNRFWPFSCRLPSDLNCGLRIGADEILKKPKQHHKCTPQTQLTENRNPNEFSSLPIFRLFFPISWRLESAPYRPHIYVCLLPSSPAAREIRSVKRYDRATCAHAIIKWTSIRQWAWEHEWESGVVMGMKMKMKRGKWENGTVCSD